MNCMDGDRVGIGDVINTKKFKDSRGELVKKGWRQGRDG